MPTIQQLITYLVNNNHVGRTHPITARRLAQHFGVSDGGTEVPIRNLIRNAIDQGELIGSSNRGFYIMNDLSEVEDNLNSLQNRAELILSRRRNMLNNWNNQQNQENPSNLPDLEINDV
ncbi:MAG: hypothetical protein WEA58_08905 [Balneolaceae bacterium]